MRLQLTILLLTTIVTIIFAQKTPAVDTRSAGMGRAFVADSPMNPANLGFRGNILGFGNEDQENSAENVQPEDRDGNPTALGVNLFIAAEYAVAGDTLSTADKVNDILARNGGISSFQSNFTGTPTLAQIQDATQLIDAISQLKNKDDSGAYADANAHLDFFFQNIAFYASSWGHAGIEPIVDLNNLALSTAPQFNTGANQIWGQPATNHNMTPSQETFANQLQADAGIQHVQAEELVFQAVQAGVNVDDPLFQNLYSQIIQATTGGGGSIANNDSGVRARSFVSYDFNLSYGQSFLDMISVGINFKVMEIYLYEESITLQNISKVQDIFNDVKDGSYFNKRVRRVERFNIDVGAAAHPFPGLSVGLYARNLIPFSVRYSNGDTQDFHTQFRLGLSYQFLDMITVALDADLNRIPYDTLKDYKAQTVGGGVEISPLSTGSPLELLLRLGAFKNVADSNQDMMVTSGIGVKFWKIAINAGGHVSWFKSVTVRSGSNDFNVFERAGFAVNVVFDTSF